MLRSSEFVKYEVPNDHTRVTRLLASINPTDPWAVSAKTSVLEDGLGKGNDFELTADFLLKDAPDKNPASRAHNISSLKSNGGGGSDKNKRNRKRENNKFGKDSDICNRGPNTGVDLRYYTDAEYKKIKPAERKELYEWQQRNKANNIGSGPKQKESTHTITTLEQPIQKFSEKVESLKQKPADNATASGSNNNHPALKKIKFSQRQGDNEEWKIPSLPLANSKKQIVPASQEGSTYSISPWFRQSIIAALYSDNDRVSDFCTELDSHADSPVVGKYATILSYTGKEVDATGFNEALGQCKSVPAANCSVAYDDMYMGTTHILQIYHALYFSNMNVNLIPPFMMHLVGIHIGKCPKFLAKAPSHKNHSVYFEKDDFRILLQLHNAVSYIPTWIPLTHELHDCVSH